MQKVTGQKYFYYIALMLMATTFLPLVFNNLPPFIRSHHIWTIIWGVSLLFFDTKIFFSKPMMYLFIYGLLLLLATQTIWSSMDEWNYKLLVNEFYEIAVGVSVITYFLQNKNYLDLAKVTKWSIVFLFITAIMTIISSGIDPMYARNITSISSITSESEREAILSFKRFGGGTYSTAGAFMCLLPIFIFYYKNIKISLLSKKQIIIFCFVVFLALFGMQIFTNILVAVAFSVIALLGMKKLRQSTLVIGIFLSILVFTPKGVYINSLQSFGNYFPEGTDLNYKFKDLALYVETGADEYDNTTGTGARIERYPVLMETFLKSPLFGCYFLSDSFGNGYRGEGIHLYWMNKLTITGIIGLLFYLFIPYNFIKNSLRYFDSTYKFYYLLAAFSILFYGLMKAVVGRETWYAFFILLPGLYYLPLLRKTDKKL